MKASIIWKECLHLTTTRKNQDVSEIVQSLQESQPKTSLFTYPGDKRAEHELIQGRQKNATFHLCQACERFYLSIYLFSPNSDCFNQDSKNKKRVLADCRGGRRNISCKVTDFLGHSSKTSPHSVRRHHRNTLIPVRSFGAKASTPTLLFLLPPPPPPSLPAPHTERERESKNKNLLFLNNVVLTELN